LAAKQPVGMKFSTLQRPCLGCVCLLPFADDVLRDQCPNAVTQKREVVGICAYWKAVWLSWLSHMVNWKTY